MGLTNEQAENYETNKQRHDHEEDQRYGMEAELRQQLDYSIGHNLISEEVAQDLWDDKVMGFQWLNRGTL
jgi:hypothetical protein